MTEQHHDIWQISFPVCHQTCPPAGWQCLTDALASGAPGGFVGQATLLAGSSGIPCHLGELALLEESMRRVVAIPFPDPVSLQAVTINPTLELHDLSWQGMTKLLAPATHLPLVPGRELVAVWCPSRDGEPRVEAIGPTELLALKVVIEELDPVVVARDEGVGVGIIDRAILQAVARGVLLSPPSRLRRPASWRPVPGFGEKDMAARIFTLQWHITQQCDLHCRHCYDRSDRRAVPLDDGIRLLDELRALCTDRFVRGQVSFSGGNPFLHPDFTKLYHAAVERGFATAILGNPVSRHQLTELLAIQPPVYFQVSLEGLEPHNDLIRGVGHFRRTLAFLALLGDLRVTSEVMLTLTADNIDQVLPLGEILRGRTHALAFNRLAPFGEGARLNLPSRERYAAFLHDYLAALPTNPVLALKDSLANIVLEHDGKELFGGCAGFGCGAAFNFLAVLADGEVHACRKFPSPLGSLHTSSLMDLYDSSAAERYRARSASCTGCALRSVCGGCPAVTAGLGGDITTDRDPHCFRT